MKIIYIGSSDELAQIFVSRMSQEGNDIYLISDEDFAKKPKGTRFHFYRIPLKGEELEDLIRSISPECIVFAGNHFNIDPTQDECDEDVTRLAQSLRAAAQIVPMKFVLLSSTGVYGKDQSIALESSQLDTKNDDRIRFIREEDLLNIYRNRSDLDTVIIRSSELYADHADENGSDLLSRSFSKVINNDGLIQDQIYQPLHASDLVDAIKRIIDNGNREIYNVSSSSAISERQLNSLISSKLGIAPKDQGWTGASRTPIADSTLIKQELGWNNIKNIESQITEGDIEFSRGSKKKGRTKDGNKKQRIPTGIRKLLENLAIFALFFVIDFFSGSSGVFAQVDWMLIYIVFIAITYSMYQTALAAVLASAVYMIFQGPDLTQFTSYYAFVNSILVVLEYIFIGVIISYTTNTLRENAQNKSEELEILQREYDDLKSINSENVLIKNEYERRLLTSNTGLPKLYDLIKRLMIQEPGRILMETMQVISELIDTNNVAVYQGQAGSPWYRLIGSLNPESAMDGKTWNISSNQDIYEAVQEGELFQGAFGSDEPAIVLPITVGNNTRVVILIKSLPYESESLYNINLLKTLALLLSDSMDKALQNENLLRDARYISNTDILKPGAFIEHIRLAQDKAEKGLADFCMIELEYQGSIEGAAREIESTLRVTDDLGIDDNNRLFILLNNTDSNSLASIQVRLLEHGIKAHPVSIQYKAN